MLDNLRLNEKIFPLYLFLVQNHPCKQFKINFNDFNIFNLFYVQNKIVKIFYFRVLMGFHILERLKSDLNIFYKTVVCVRQILRIVQLITRCTGLKDALYLVKSRHLSM